MPNHQPQIKRRIGLLGGSFNPAHTGHREISLEALDLLGLDAVWWLVTPGNPLKAPDSYAEYDERLHGARAVADHPDIVVSDFERRRNLQYTVDTLLQARDANPNTSFVWLMGADSLANFHRWKDWQTIAELVPLAVFNRPGYGDGALQGEAAMALKNFRLDPNGGADLLTAEPPAWVFFDQTNNPLSSTEIRNRKKLLAGETVNDLTAPKGPLAFFLDTHPDAGDFRTDVIEGLSAPQKNLSPKYFYDAAGSKIFRKITEVPEYYPTLTEKKIFLDNAAAICSAAGRNTAVFEYGSGASEKIEWLLNGLENPAAYVAMDISKEFLLQAAGVIAKKFAMPVAAICADFYEHVHIPKGILPDPNRWLGFFPGSTIGNMMPEEAARFLRRAGETLGPGAQLLLGVDLEKDPAIINAAYNDSAGVTAAFNLNLLARMQRELGAAVAIEDFEHYAFYNEEFSRIEMHLRTLKATKITLDGQEFSFEAGETLHTENSHKYSINRLKALFSDTPWRLETQWTDEKGWFAACLLSHN